jgi:hypothetical protein
MFDNYCPKGSSADSDRISELGGTAIDDYLPEAIEILAAHRQELGMMSEELERKWCESLFTGRPNPFEVMSSEEVDAVHRTKRD